MSNIEPLPKNVPACGSPGGTYGASSAKPMAPTTPLLETMAAFVLAEHVGGMAFEPPEGAAGHGGQRQHQGDGIHHLAPPVDGHATGVHRRDGVHDRLPSPRFMRASISRDRLSTTKVMRNRISPR